MALSSKDKKIRDDKVSDLDSKIAARNELKERMISKHQEEIAKVQDQIDQETLLRDALTALK